MKRLPLLIALLLLPGWNAYAQKAGDADVAVTGTVMGVEARCVDGKPAVELRLYLQFHNKSDKPLLLIRPNTSFSTRINFLANDLGGSDISTVAGEVVRYNPFLENPYGPPTKEDFDPLASLVRDPDSWKAPDALLPGAYFEFPHTIWLRNGFRIKGKRIVEQKACGPSSFAPVAEYGAFHIEYNLSLKKYPSASEALRNLQDRWRPQGHLPVDGNGEITYRSEKILFESSK